MYVRIYTWQCISSVCRPVGSLHGAHGVTGCQQSSRCTPGRLQHLLVQHIKAYIHRSKRDWISRVVMHPSLQHARIPLWRASIPSTPLSHSSHTRLSCSGESRPLSALPTTSSLLASLQQHSVKGYTNLWVYWIDGSFQAGFTFAELKFNKLGHFGHREACDIS